MQNSNDLKEAVASLKVTHPKLRARDIASKLDVSEVEIVSLSVGENVVRLEGDWKELLIAIREIGYVMALTRNDHCVHERKGVYDNVKFYGGPHNMGVAVNPDIDLRFFMNEWAYGLAVTMDRGKGRKLYGFQFFDKHGEAVHKIYSTPKSDIGAYVQLVDKFKSKIQVAVTDIDRRPSESKNTQQEEDVDVLAFQDAWKRLKDTHDFYGLLQKHKVTRTQGFRLAPEGFTQKVDNQTVVPMLKQAAEQLVPIMCFVHSKGCIQIHTGEIHTLKEYGTWYNVMDPAFNLHLDMSKIAETWIVKKPTKDGIVTSVELFDQSGELIVYFFGARKPGKPELESWREIVANLRIQSPTVVQ